MTLLNSRAAKARVIGTFGLLSAAFVLSVLLYREGYAELQTWLNLYDYRNLKVLEWSRVLNLIAIGITIVHLGRVMLDFPEHKRFYFMVGLYTLAFLYFFTQWLGTDDIYPRNGFILMNLVSAGLSASFNVALNFASDVHTRRR